MKIRPKPPKLGFQRPLGAHLAGDQQERRPMMAGLAVAIHYVPPTIWTCAAEPGEFVGCSRRSTTVLATGGNGTECLLTSKSAVRTRSQDTWREWLDRCGTRSILVFKVGSVLIRVIEFIFAGIC
jgi:hypothetical protein